MNRLWLALSAGVGVLVGAVGCVGIYLVANNWNLPDWLKTNSGPWIAFSAVLAFTGVVVGVVVQAHLAQKDRDLRENQSDADRKAQAERAESDWYRQQRYTAYDSFISAIHNFNNDRSKLREQELSRAHTQATLISDRESAMVLITLLSILVSPECDDDKGENRMRAHNFAIMWLTNILAEQDEAERQRRRASLIAKLLTRIDEFGWSRPEVLETYLRASGLPVPDRSAAVQNGGAE